MCRRLWPWLTWKKSITELPRGYQGCEHQEGDGDLLTGRRDRRHLVRRPVEAVQGPGVSGDAEESERSVCPAGILPVRRGRRDFRRSREVSRLYAAAQSDACCAHIDLFHVLDTKPEERDPYTNDDLAAFPYVKAACVLTRTLSFLGWTKIL